MQYDLSLPEVEGSWICVAAEERDNSVERAEVVVGCCNYRVPEYRNTVQEQGDPNPAELVTNEL